jgi:hypothetical protein
MYPLLHMRRLNFVLLFDGRLVDMNKYVQRIEELQMALETIELSSQVLQDQFPDRSALTFSLLEMSTDLSSALLEAQTTADPAEQLSVVADTDEAIRKQWKETRAMVQEFKSTMTSTVQNKFLPLGLARIMSTFDDCSRRNIEMMRTAVNSRLSVNQFDASTVIKLFEKCVC